MRRVLAAFFLAAACSALAPMAFAQSAVDFGKAPSPGLTYRVVDQRVAEYEKPRNERGAVEKGTAEEKAGAKTERRSHTCHTAFTQTIQAVRDDRVVGLEREYQAWFADGPFAAVARPAAEADATAAKAKARRIDFRGLRVRAIRGGLDGRWRVEQKHGDRWGAAKGKRITRGYNYLEPRLLRHPLVPLPRSRVRVGDTWQFDFECDQTYFPLFWPHVKAGTPGWSWNVTYRLERVREYQQQRCAVIVVNAEVRGRSAHKGIERTYDLSARGTYYYSLKHRIVVAMDLDSDTESWFKGEGFARGGAATERRTVTVEILKEGKPTAEASR